MKSARNWIIGAGIVMFLASGGTAIVKERDIPENMKAVLLMIFAAGVGIEPLTGMTTALTKNLSKKEEVKE